jgi:lysozyme
MSGAATEGLQLAAGLCRRFEGLRLRPYLCPAGVATVGYGSTRYLDGRAVQLVDAPITAAHAEVLLADSLRRVYLPAVLQLCPAVDDPRRLGAVLVFTYNLGAGNLKASTLRRKVNAGDWGAVPGELRKWVRGGGRVLPGLVTRREAEAALIG